VFGTLAAGLVAGHICSTAFHRTARYILNTGLRAAHIGKAAAACQAYNARVAVDTNDQIFLLHGKRFVSAFDDFGSDCLVGE
jgi:hypothetical protein